MTGDSRRYAALLTDDFMRRSLGWVHRGLFADGPPEPSPLRVPLPSIEAVRGLPVGRVAAETRNHHGRGLAVFVVADGRYLLDDAFELPEDGTPAP